MKRLPIVIFALVALVGGYFVGNMYQKDAAAKPLLATVLTPAKEIRDFKLTSGTNEDFTLQNFKGHWTLVYFGYTFCPDICPTSLMHIVQVYNRLADQPKLQESLKTLFISVDPARDNPKRLHEYTTYFKPDFLSATGDEETLQQLARDFSVFYKLHEPDENGNYPVDHSSAVSLVNPDGKIEAVFVGIVESQQVAADLVAITDI